jgi:hypothetical protein
MKVFFTRKVTSTLSEIWVGDTRSGIRKKNFIRIPDHGAKNALGSRISNTELASRKNLSRILDHGAEKNRMADLQH